MSIADIKYKQLITDIYENGDWDISTNVRAKYADGTPAYSKSVFGRQVVFEEDELPVRRCSLPQLLKKCIYFGLNKQLKYKTLKTSTVIFGMNGN